MNFKHRKFSFFERNIATPSTSLNCSVREKRVLSSRDQTARNFNIKSDLQRTLNISRQDQLASSDGMSSSKDLHQLDLDHNWLNVQPIIKQLQLKINNYESSINSRFKIEKKPEKKELQKIIEYVAIRNKQENKINNQISQFQNPSIKEAVLNEPENFPLLPKNDMSFQLKCKSRSIINSVQSPSLKDFSIDDQGAVDAQIYKSYQPSIKQIVQPVTNEYKRIMDKITLFQKQSEDKELLYNQIEEMEKQICEVLEHFVYKSSEKEIINIQVNKFC